MTYYEVLTILRCQGQIVVQELSELHDHVGEARVRDVGVGVVLLGHVPGIRKPRWASATSGDTDTILRYKTNYI